MYKNKHTYISIVIVVRKENPLILTLPILIWGKSSWDHIYWNIFNTIHCNEWYFPYWTWPFWFHPTLRLYSILWLYSFPIIGLRIMDWFSVSIYLSSFSCCFKSYISVGTVNMFLHLTHCTQQNILDAYHALANGTFST